MPDTQWVKNRYGQQMLIDPNDFIGQKVLRNKIYDLETLLLLERLFARLSPEVILDVGANVGNHMLMFSRHAARVLAFEPGTKAFAMLEQNVKANNLAHVSPFNVGLSDQPTTQTLYVEASGNLGASSLSLENLADTQYVEDTISLRVGDDIVGAQQLPSVDFIKIDVEGHEQSVIRGLRKTIAAQRPLILMEWEVKGDWLEQERRTPDLLRDYVFYPLIWNTSRAYWKQQPFGLLRRSLLRVFGTKQRVPCRWDAYTDAEAVSDILLVPKEKCGLVEPLVYGART
ncbi:FkbM family methyltransferase [Pusillimonas sp.]|uniref:FkbM family methyltransferase n=1 Tax=Pusillimonas sp. TaxID=3040095 RepID=UPI002D7E7734|nr:FkbM family methyltransferase [Pusillimonas sp.]